MSKVFGYGLRDDGTVEIIPAEAEIVRMVFQRILEGQTLKEIKIEIGLRNFHTRLVLTRCAVLGQGGGFVFNPVHNVQVRTPIAKVVAMIDAVHEYNGD